MGFSYMSDMHSGGSRKSRTVLFLPAPHKPHAKELMTLVDRFVGEQAYQVHIWLPSAWSDIAPHGKVTLHQGSIMDNISRAETAYAKVVNMASRRQGFLTSYVDYMSALVSLGEIDFQSKAGVKEVMDKVKPHIVIADGFWQSDARVAYLAQAHHKNAKFYSLVRRGRPEISAAEMEEAEEKHGDELMDLEPKMVESMESLTKILGNPTEKKDHWYQLFPSCRSILGGVANLCPSEKEIFIGPLSAPEKLRQKSLIEWFDQEGDLPVVYVHLGQIAKPEGSLIMQLAQGLYDPRWRVLWSLPAAWQADLPVESKSWEASKWRVDTEVPQMAVLGQPKVKCMITHCGVASIHEALMCGKPMVCIPFCLDNYQWADTLCEERKAGVQLNKDALTSLTANEAIHKVLFEPSFTQMAKECEKEISRLRQNMEELLLGNFSENIGASIATALVKKDINQREVERMHTDEPSSSVGR